MRELFEVMAVAFAVCLGGGAAGVAVIVRRLRRANRLTPNRPGPAPLHWQWSWRRTAQLHRRLRRACQLAAAAAGYDGPAASPPPVTSRWRRRREMTRSPLIGVAESLISQALTLDGQLVMADRLGSGWRRSRVAGLEVEVRRVEAAAARMSRLSVAWQEHLRSSVAPAAPAMAAEDLETRLNAVEAALGDLSAVRPVVGVPVLRPGT